MRHFRLSVTALVLTALLLLGLCTPAAAAGDPVEEFAQEMLQAVRNEKNEARISLRDVSDFEALMWQAFERYPMLYYYFGGVEWTTFFSSVDVTVSLEDVDEPVEQVCVIRSEEELMAVLGLGLARTADHVSFVCADGFMPDTQMISDQFERLRHEHSLAFLGYHGYSYTYSTSDHGICSFRLDYEYFYDLPAQTISQWRSETEAAAIGLAGTLFASDMPDHLRVLRIHDWIINNTRYNSKNMDEAGNHLSYGALVRGSCVCQGYAEAFLLLARAAGLEVVYVTGDATNSSGQTEAHAWNAVKVQGEWYMIDLTWDDPITSDGSDMLRYDYFLVSSQKLAEDHTWDQAAAPACTGSSLDADWVLAWSAQDQTTYRQFDADAIKTVAESTAELSRILSGSTALPGTTPPATEPPTTPTAPPVVLPAATTTPGPTQATTPSDPSGDDEGGSGSFLWILVILAALVCGGGGVVRSISSRRRSGRYTSSFGSSPFGGGSGRNRRTPPKNEHRRVQW